MGREVRGWLPVHTEALPRVHVRLPSASCVPGPGAHAKSEGVTEKRVLRGVRGAASRISLRFGLEASTEASHPGPDSRDEQGPDPQPLLSRPSVGTDHAAVTAELSAPTPEERPPAHTGGGHRMHTHVTHTCSHPHHARAHSRLRPRRTHVFNGDPKHFYQFNCP